MSFSFGRPTETPCAMAPCKNGSSHAWESTGDPGSGQQRCHKCGCYRWFLNGPPRGLPSLRGGRRKTRRGTRRNRRNRRASRRK